jgi:2-oxoglutarate ferredoxin oxidoreductase subunit beta
MSKWVLEDTIGVSPVGCAYNNYEYFSCDMVQASHGRAPAVATGIKRTVPDKKVFAYQGDGDLASIGTAEIVHAAARGEKISVFFINNTIYGMTSGQMAPTTLVGQVTTTSPFGRDPETQGYPINVSEMLAPMRGSAYIERVALNNFKNIQAAKERCQCIRVQHARLGFSMVRFSRPADKQGKEPFESASLARRA